MWRCALVLIVACKAPSPLDGDVPKANAVAAYCRNHAVFTTSSLTGTPSLKRPTNTYSIVARDPKTGELGVAVQSHWFSVGSIVTWAEAGVGAVATQAMVNPMYGARGIALMRDGVSAPDALRQLLPTDSGSEERQVGIVDAMGRAEAHTGAKCIQHAGHFVGPGYAIQANLMANELVVPAMARAFERSPGDLTDRILAALDAAQEVGGDIRGCQSAAILVVSGVKSDTPWREKRLDLRVEDSPAPLTELRRLVGVSRAYDHMNRGEARVLAGDTNGGIEEFTIATGMFPDHPEMNFWPGVFLAGKGQFDRAAPYLRRAFQADPAWIELVRRMPPTGLLPDRATAERAIAEAQK